MNVSKESKNKAKVKKVHAHIKKPFTIKKTHVYVCLFVCVRACVYACVCDYAHRIISDISKQFRHCQRLLQKNYIPNTVDNLANLVGDTCPDPG